jgi:hypothetical protein
MLGRLAGTVRRNHALEHATIAVLLRRIGHDVRMVGRATGDGLPLCRHPDGVADATHEALQRMKSGEGHLAVSPFCGTIPAVARLAGCASMVTMGTGSRSQKVPNHPGVDAGCRAATGQMHSPALPDELIGDTEIVGIKSRRGGADSTRCAPAYQVEAVATATYLSNCRRSPPRRSSTFLGPVRCALASAVDVERACSSRLIRRPLAYASTPPPTA